MTNPITRPRWRVLLRFVVAPLLALVFCWLTAPTVQATVQAAEITVDAACTLADAITAANLDSARGGCPAGNGVDTLLLQAGRSYTLTTAAEANSVDGLNDNGLPTITSKITIRSDISSDSSSDPQNSPVITRDPSFACPGGAGEPNFRILAVAITGALTVQNVTIQQGCAASGAGIYNDGGRVTIQQGRLLANVATGAGGNGGGINNNGGDLTVADSLLRANQAARGGALFNVGGTVTVTGSTALSNTANFGGGLYNTAGALTLTNSHVRANAAGSGGGLYNSLTGHVTLYNSHLRSNGAENGGALFNEGAVTLAQSQVVSNTAGVDGGALYNFGSDAQMTIGPQSRLMANGAVGNGGAFFNEGIGTLTRTQVVSNTAGRNGGGFYNQGADAQMMIGQESGLVANRAGEDGGAFYNRDGSVQVQSSHLISNSAELGGGIYIDGAGAVVTLTQQSTLVDNSADSNGGGVYNLGGALTLQNSQMLSNTATHDGGGFFTDRGHVRIEKSQIVSSRALRGGGFYNFDSTVRVQNSQILSNTASVGGGLRSDGDAVTSITQQSTLAGNQAVTLGGGIYKAMSVVTIQDSFLLSNLAGTDGGALYQIGGATLIDQGCLVGNGATALVNQAGAVDAKENWWGAADGPSLAGPGSGDTVGAQVDFAPFLSAPILGCSAPGHVYLPLIGQP